jgi:hypothetical protein
LRNYRQFRERLDAPLVTVEIAMVASSISHPAMPTS